MRDINIIFVHCTAGNQRQKITDLLAEFRMKGWKNPGYHYVVDADGVTHQLQSVEKVSNGVRGFNAHSINVAYLGGIDAKGRPVDNRTEAQKIELRELLQVLHKQLRLWDTATYLLMSTTTARLIRTRESRSVRVLTH